MSERKSSFPCTSMVRATRPTWERARKAQRSYLQSTEQPKHLEAVCSLQSARRLPRGWLTHPPLCTWLLDVFTGTGVKKRQGSLASARWSDQTQSNSNSCRWMDRSTPRVVKHCSPGHRVQLATWHSKGSARQRHIGCEVLFPVDSHTASHGFLSDVPTGNILRSLSLFLPKTWETFSSAEANIQLLL